MGFRSFRGFRSAAPEPSVRSPVVDWLKYLPSVATVLVSIAGTGVVAKIVAGRKARAREELVAEVEIFKNLPSDLPAKVDFAIELSYALRSYWAPDPHSSRHRLKQWSVATGVSTGLGLVANLLGLLVATSASPDAIFFATPSSPKAPDFWAFWIGAAVALIGAFSFLWVQLRFRLAVQTAELHDRRREKAEDMGLNAELRERLKVPLIPVEDVVERVSSDEIQGERVAVMDESTREFVPNGHD